jgi:hypothetical protein
MTAKNKQGQRQRQGPMQGSFRYALRASVEMTEVVVEKADSSAALRNDSQKGKCKSQSRG